MKVLNLRRPVVGATWAAAITMVSLIAPAQAQVGNPNLIPAKSAYVISVPDSKALWNAWQGNAIYASYKKAMESPELSSTMGNFNKELQTIESVLGYKLNGETISTIFKNADIYIGPGENAGSHSMGAILGVADKDKLNKLLDLAEKAAAEAVTEPEPDKAESSEGTKDKESKDKDSKDSAPAKKSGSGKSGTKAKPAKSGESEGMGGADDTETTKSDSAKGSGPISKETYSGVTVKRFASGEDNEIYYALAGDLLLVSNDRGEIKALVDRSKSGTDTDSLGGSAGFKKITAALSSRPGEAYLFGNQKEAMEMQQGGGMEAIREITEKLNPVDVYGSSVKIEPKQITHYSYGIMAGDTSSSLLSKHPGDKPLEAIKYVSAEPLFAFGTSLLDSDMLYKLLTDAANSTGNKGVEDQLKSAELMLGFSVKNDLIPALGNDMALGINSVKISGGNPNVDAALILSVRDKDKMQKVLTGLEKIATNAMASQSSGASESESSDKGGADDESKKGSSKKSAATKEKAAGFKELKVGENTIHYVDSPSMFNMTPGYVLDGDFLVIGSTKEAMQSAIEVKSGNKSLADSEAIKALGPRISTTGNMFQFMNFSGIWTTAEGLAKSMLNPTLATVFDSMKVLKIAAGVSSVKDGAVVSEGVVLLQ